MTMSQNQNPLNTLNSPTFKEFASKMTPQGAKAEIKRMMESGELSQEKLQESMNQLQTVASLMGAKI